MKERPILFSGPMVRSLLAGTKTQTRRVIKPRHLAFFNQDAAAMLNDWNERPLPYGKPGDRLWVRETWQVARETLDYETGGEYDVWEWPDELGDARQHLNGDARFGTKAGLFYAAEGESKNPGVFYDLTGIDNKTILRRKEISWRPSIHMPRWASRITLEITSVRVERLQDISEADALAEGIVECPIPADDEGPRRIGYMVGPDDGKSGLSVTPIQAYRDLWESINGPESWAANPWVWAIEFRRLP